MHFVVTNINESDDITLLFAPKICNDGKPNTQNISCCRIWRRLPGRANCHDGVWESPAWRCGQFDLDILIRVFRNDGKKFEFFTSEVAAFGSIVESSALRLIEVYSFYWSGFWHFLTRQIKKSCRCWLVGLWKQFGPHTFHKALQSPSLHRITTDCKLYEPYTEDAKSRSKFVELPPAPSSSYLSTLVGPSESRAIPNQISWQ